MNSLPAPPSNGVTNNSGGAPPAALAASSRSGVEEQWRWLWRTQSPQLLDPADVVASLDMLRSRVIDKLSPSEVTFLQRRVRAILKPLPSRANAPSRRFMSNQQNVPEVDAKLVASQQHLLTNYLVSRLFPRTTVVCKQQPQVTIQVVDNLYIIALYLSEALWPRVAQVAQQTAALAGLDMDVNKQIKNHANHNHNVCVRASSSNSKDNYDDDGKSGKSASASFEFPMPKPSLVPDLADKPALPSGVSLVDLAFLLAMATRGTRRERLQLLFYCCWPTNELQHFLDTHPAGGVPTWLLEVDQNQVISVASLTHYHYFGHAFLPVAATAEPQHPTFVPSQSRKPVTVAAQVVLDLIQMLLSGVSSATASNTPRSPNGGSGETYVAGSTTNLNPAAAASTNSPASPTPSPTRRQSYKIRTKTSGDSENVADDSSKADDASSTPTVASQSELMRTLQEVADGRLLDMDTEAPLLLESQQRFHDARATIAIHDKTRWSLSEFERWAHQGLDDHALDTCFHGLLGRGLLPSPYTERELCRTKWNEWTDVAMELWETQMLRNGKIPHPRPIRMPSVWGGIGGIDGAGGTGMGVVYCIDKQWWNQWMAYTGGWSETSRKRNRKRPGHLSSSVLLEKESESFIPGTMGFYEPMKKGLRLNQDYVVVPPGVWDVLFEIYGGGPPLPRMILSPGSYSAMKEQASKPIDPPTGNETPLRVPRLPDNISLEVHPWIIHCSLCDPQQPYRRGDAGAVNIRIMAAPEQPLWRLFGEIIMRLPLQAYKTFDQDGRSKARLWKRADTGGQKEPGTRYGPWNLLCKNRHGALPLISSPEEIDAILPALKDDWMSYTENLSVAGSGLGDGSQLLFEFMVMNKNNQPHWPREAAAKAGHARRVAEEDTHFRYLLQGLDKDGNIMLKPPRLVGMTVDAIDSTGRWYPVAIEQVEIVDDDTDEDTEDEKEKLTDMKCRKKVKVVFNDGHYDWIDVESDRIAKAGRFTSDADQQDSSSETKSSSSAGPKEPENSKAKQGAAVKKSTNSNESNSAENMKVCLLPGFGACGLTNLGNTCYANSAVQCIGYIPLLRSYLLSAQYKATGDLNKDNPLGTGGRLLEELADLLRSMWSAKYGEKSARTFRQRLGNINSQFSGGDQQDAQEFLNYVLDVLHEDSNKVRKKPYVEAIEDDWVKRTTLPRVGDEAWRRFLRRNQSIMTDVAMGQVLNTVTCPVCKFSSRNFDPFNLLSIPIPTVADVVFQCIVVRRATAMNTPWTLNKPRKGEKKATRFSRRQPKSSTVPPSDAYIGEQYFIAMSRLADSSDLKHHVSKVCAIPVNRLRLCRAEAVVVNNDVDDNSVLRSQTKVIPLTEKEGPCSHLAKKRGPNEDVASPTILVAYENTLRPRSAKQNGESSTESLDSTVDEDDDTERNGERFPSPRQEKEIMKLLEVYGDEKECRLVDSDPLLLAKGISRSLWPRNEHDLQLGLRVDAKDKRGNWFQGSVVEVIDEGERNGEGAGSKEREVVVHFDNFAKKWDETYTIEDFEEGRVQPLYSHAIPKMKPMEALVHHRYTDRASGKSVIFGQAFFVHCYNEWSNARAGAQILAQASRYLQYNSDWSAPLDLDDPSAIDRENRANRVYEKTQGAISDLIDLLLDFDRDYVAMALGFANQNGSEGKTQPLRNPSFDATAYSSAMLRKVSALMQRLPFEIRVTGIDTTNSAGKGAVEVEEEVFQFSLVRSVGNTLHARQVFVLHWRELPAEKKTGIPSPGLRDPILYIPLAVEVDKASLDVLKKSQKVVKERAKRTRPGNMGVDIDVCLAEFCKTQNLSLDDNWRCPQCKEFREGRQNMSLWRLPDMLTFHIKRFNMSARWREKISTRVNFPLTELDLSEWCHKESPVIQQDSSDSYVYDLMGVINHYGSMTGGHYVAFCKASACGKDGREEVAFDFGGTGATLLETEGTETGTGWRLGRPKVETNQSKEAAAMASKAAAESAEPLWLQFDDELVDPIAPKQVVSEMAYVLFYRRRRLTPSNIVKYSTLE